MVLRCKKKTDSAVTESVDAVRNALGLFFNNFSIVFHNSFVMSTKHIKKKSVFTIGGPDGIRTRDLGLDRAAC